MSFLQLVRREMHGSLPKLVFMSGVGGVSNASILAAINTGVQEAGSGQKPGLWAAALFVVALFLFMKAQQFVTITATAEIEAIIHKVRVRLMDQIRHSELLELERIGRARIVASVTSDTAILTQASNMLCFTVQGAVLIFFVGLYVAYLSLAAFVLTAVIVVGAGMVFHYKNKRLAAQKSESAAGSAGSMTGSPTSSTASRKCASTPRAAPICSTTPPRCRRPRPISRSAPRPKPSR